jgi:hypothetical protein
MKQLLGTQVPRKALTGFELGREWYEVQKTGLNIMHHLRYTIHRPTFPAY